MHVAIKGWSTEGHVHLKYSLRCSFPKMLQFMHFTCIVHAYIIMVFSTVIMNTGYTFFNTQVRASRVSNWVTVLQHEYMWDLIYALYACGVVPIHLVLYIVHLWHLVWYLVPHWYDTCTLKTISLLQKVRSWLSEGLHNTTSCSAPSM